MKEAAGESKNSVIAAHSSSVPMRAAYACEALVCLMRSRKWGAYESSPELSMTPGASALMRPLDAAHSMASVLGRLATPARAAPEWTIPGMPFRKQATMLTIANPFEVKADGGGDVDD